MEDGVQRVPPSGRRIHGQGEERKRAEDRVLGLPRSGRRNHRQGEESKGKGREQAERSAFKAQKRQAVRAEKGKDREKA